MRENFMTYENLIFDQERALYGITGATVNGCTFAGEADGESALKETSDITVNNCRFDLRYPMWHMRNSLLCGSFLTQTCRAPLWYCDNTVIEKTKIDSVKAVRECSAVKIDDCKINSPEFGWFCRDVSVISGEISGEYPFLKTEGLVLNGMTLNGKYSFQYVQNATVSNCVLNTKDAFWHAKNVVVKNSVVKGEYLAWYSENVTFERCKIIGTQPLCYCKGLTLIECEMIDCDLSFERSEVKASIKGAIESVKNPISGSITAGSVGRIILDIPSSCEIKTGF